MERFSVIEKHASKPGAIPLAHSLGPSMGFLMSWNSTSSMERVKEQVCGYLLMLEAGLPRGSVFRRAWQPASCSFSGCVGAQHILFPVSFDVRQDSSALPKCLTSPFKLT